MKYVHTFGAGRLKRQADTTLLFQYITSIIEITNLNVEGCKSYLPVFLHYLPLFPGKCHWHGKYAYLPAFCQPWSEP